MPTGEPSTPPDAARGERPLSWASSSAERDLRVASAQALVGREILAVRYCNIDYSRWDLARGTLGPRVVTSPGEWESPTWRYAACDSIDYGIEIETTLGEVFSVSWDPPGTVEGIGIVAEPIPTALRPDADVAMWDVTDRSEWSQHVGATVQGVGLHYVPWDEPDDSWWCPRLSIRLPGGDVEVLLADTANDGTIVPSADNVVVLFGPDELPSWVRSAQS